VSLGFWIGAGSRDEPETKAGVSHFIEHLLFKGTRAYDAQQIAEIFDGMGGELNAATSREHTVVYARVPDRHLEEALDVMADMVFSPTFADLDSEREVVLEEIAMVEDAPQDLVHDLLSEAVFSEHPLGRPVIGRADVISSISRRSISSYHRRAYVAGNVVLAAAGNLEHDQLLGLLERAARQRVEPPAKTTRVRSPLVREPPPSLRFQRKDTEQFHVCIGAPGLSRSDRRRFAASILDAILGGSASSRLFRRSARSVAWPTRSTASALSTRTRASSASTSAPARRTSGLPRDRRRADRRHRRWQPARPRAAAREGESEGPDRALDGVHLQPDEPPRPVADHRYELLSLDRIIAEIDAVDPTALAELAGVLLDPARLSAAGIGPGEERFLEGVELVHPGLATAA
jgi:predicted Zn-dependent peptidase